MGQGRARREAYDRGRQAAAAARQVTADYRAAAERVRAQAGLLREEAVLTALDAMPVARIRDVTEGRARVAALEGADYRTVGRVHRAEVYELLRVPGIGRVSAEQAKSAAAQLARATAEATAVRIDPDRREPAATALLEALYPFVAAGPSLPTARQQAEALADALEPLLTAAAPTRSALRLALSGRRQREQALAALAEAAALLAGADADGTREVFAQATTDLLRLPGTSEQAWWEFTTRAAEFYTALGQLDHLGLDDAASAQGHLPDDLAAQVRAQPLDTSLLRVSLRGYQAFGARYALARRRVVLGDEMGLGKTVQAIAVMTHLAATGEQRHFLVVCPASVLVNWEREIQSRSALGAHRLHGPDRDLAADAWRRHGGVAVTTFETLRHLDAAAGPATVLVVDEAHYVKNAAAQRSRQVAAHAQRCGHVLFLTGTPMENRLAEFRSLLSYLQPDLLPDPGRLEALPSAVAFRRAVAPAYLRRNQDDVLSELPDLVHTDDWQEFSPADAEAYRDAVLAGNFQAMRRAAYARPEHSAKLRRLVEITGAALAANEKVLVFSYYRDVLGTVHERVLSALGGTAPVFGPIAGSTDPARRQETVDAFTEHPGPAVLLAQIQAGGVGLNLQAASVVVLCEPQVKPALEQQAVARAHRMGQTRRVRVHRLLTPGATDQRMLRLLDRKQRLFDAYARRSEAAETAPEALDVSDTSLARLIVEEEQQRLAAEKLHNP
ncbi:DEAD/DEAH box helicase [Streptacidiphilus cavernicola]|uniref:DEAD/DEAH box helicase n=1 Tax=Streptacidiphilus cavernicola TaxID=3342716 RepID=A0ABV6VQW8_9ACTN